MDDDQPIIWRTSLEEVKCGGFYTEVSFLLFSLAFHFRLIEMAPTDQDQQVQVFMFVLLSPPTLFMDAKPGHWPLRGMRL